MDESDALLREGLTGIESGLAHLASAALDPLFWPVERLGAESAWWLHVPFAHWVVAVTAPRALVELGTHTGVSYAAFCQAVMRSRLGTRCHAVDTWRGDSQAGEYGEEVFKEFSSFHDERYAGFSTLLRCTFDEALEHIAAGSIDLLHIDGLHTYDAVRHDFESWVPKLSDRGVVLFHDTNERHGDFGVWRLWAELRERHAGFEFLHGHGLGVLAAGPRVPPAIRALCALDDRTAATVRERFCQLGERWRGADEGRRAAEDAARSTVAAAVRGAEEAGRRADAAEAHARRQEVQARTTESALQAAERGRRRAEERAGDAPRIEQEAREARRLAEEAAQQRDALLNSTSWRVTAPLRAATRMLPGSARRHVRRALKAAWWVLTPWRIRARLAFRRGRRELAASTKAPLPAIHAAPPYARWIKAFERFPAAGEGERSAGVIRFSLLLPCIGAEEATSATFDSLCRQTNVDWEMVLPDTPAARQATSMAAAKRRIVFVPHVAEERGAALAALLAAANGAWFGVLDAGDVLAPQALDCVARAIASEPAAAIVYGDEDLLGTSGQRVRPQFKPGWSPELLHAYNYFGHVTMLSRALAQDAGGFAPGLGAGAEWALNLRAADGAVAKCRPILRLPHVLCHRPETGEGDRPGPSSHAAAELRTALQSYWTSRGIKRPLVSTQPDGTQRSSWEVTPAPLVSVVIPNRNSAALLRRCLTGLLEQTRYPAVEVVIVENSSDDPEIFALYEKMERTGRVRVVRFEGPFNYSASCNLGARAARGSLLLFLNNDIEVEDPGWLGELVRVASLPGVGVVGTKLRYPTGELQHAGVGVGVHLYALMFHRAPEEEWGVFGSPNHTRNWSAIMGACQMIRRDVFDRAGGFDEAYGIAHSDIALCLRAGRLGYRTAYTPFAALVHHEGASRGRHNPEADVARAAREIRRLGIEEDTYLHPGLSGESVVPRLRAPGDGSWREVLRRNLTEHLVAWPEPALDLFDEGAVLEAVGAGREAVFWLPQPEPELSDQWAAARWILDLLRMRADIRVRFPRALSEGREGSFASWLAGPAGAEMALPDGLGLYPDALFTNDPGARARQTYFRCEAARILSPLGLLPPGRRSLAAWLFREGRAEHGLRREEIWWFLLASAEAPARELVRLYRFTPAWQAAHPAGLTVFGRTALAAWLAERYDLPADAAWLDPATWPDLPEPAEQIRLAYAANETWRRVRPDAFATPESAEALLEWLASPSAGLLPEVRAWCAERSREGLARSAARPGANIIGHFCYPSGLRVSVEAMSDAMEEAGVAVSRRDIRTDPGDEPYHARFCGLEPYDISIIHAQPEPFFAEVYSRADLAPRRPRPYRIGYWYWEFDTIPSTWDEAAAECDELWTATDFVAQGLRARYRKPVHVFLPGLELPAYHKRPRSYFGLPDKPFIFLFAFHMTSVTERKNPTGLISAFYQAFGADDDAVLVIKTSFGERFPSEMKALRDAAPDHRVKIIDAVYDQDQTISLTACADAYVSLHRSEGLGLTMAEAMLLGKPTIATGYSGNLEFMNADNSLLVDYRLVPLGRDYPPYTAELKWAEPSVRHAAQLMRRLHDERSFAAALGSRGQADLRFRLSHAHTGRRMAERLAAIGRMRRNAGVAPRERVHPG